MKWPFRDCGKQKGERGKNGRKEEQMVKQDYAIIYTAKKYHKR